MKYPFHHGDVISYFPFHISGVGKNVPGFGDLFHIAKTNICWKLYAQELGDVKHWDIYQPLSINICHDLPHVFFLIVFFLNVAEWFGMICGGFLNASLADFCKWSTWSIRNSWEAASFDFCFSNHGEIPKASDPHHSQLQRYATHIAAWVAAPLADQVKSLAVELLVRYLAKLKVKEQNCCLVQFLHLYCFHSRPCFREKHGERWRPPIQSILFEKVMIIYQSWGYPIPIQPPIFSNLAQLEKVEVSV